jgi:hypothetical protein
MAGFKFPDEQDDVPANKQGQLTDTDIEITGLEDDDVEISIVDDTPERDRGRKPLDRNVDDPTDDELDTYTDNVKKRIKELTHARHDERRAKEAVAREKQELERLTEAMIAENNRLKQYVQTGTEQYKGMVAQAAEAKLEKARRDYKAAQESFDTDAMMAAQEALTDAKWELQNAKNFRAPPLQEAKEELQIQQPQTQRAQTDEKTLRWQAKNQWFGQQGFEEYTSYALGLHQKLVTNGVDPRSAEYFEQIDARMKSTFPDLFGQTNDKPRSGEAQKRPTTVVASVSRSTSAGKIKLTQTQVALAKKFGLTPQQYAAQVAKLEN